jgi:hypothetical protein
MIRWAHESQSRVAVPYGRLLRDGDVMEGTITGLGVQRTHVAAEEATR